MPDANMAIVYVGFHGHAKKKRNADMNDQIPEAYVGRDEKNRWK